MHIVISLFPKLEVERLALALGFATMAEQARADGAGVLSEHWTAAAMRVLAEEPVSLPRVEHLHALAFALRAAEATGRWKERPRLPVSPVFRPEVSDGVRAALKMMADQLEGAI